MMLRGLVGRRRPFVRAIATSVVFLIAWGFLHTGVFHREYKLEAGEDVGIYQSYGDAVHHGGVPYRDFAVVYPPGALPAFIVPAWAGNYDRAFEVEMLACGLAMAFLIGLATSWWPGLLLAGVSPVLIGDLMQTRYDLWPAVLTTGAMLALLRDRHRLGWALLAAAVVSKGYTACLFPLAAFWTARRAGLPELRRAASWAVGVIVVVLLPFFIVAPHGMWESFRSQIVRPLQIESLGGAILMTDKRAQIVFTYGSHNIAGTPAEILANGFEVIGLCALIWCWWRFARGSADAERFCLFAAASVTAFVTFGKVLSPQYLIWLVPVVALVRGRRGLTAIGLLTAACLLTHWWTPSRYGEYKDEFRWTWVVLGRDLVLVMLFAVLAWPTNHLPWSKRASAIAPAEART
jgi:uncharacterized membrane protein